MRIIQAVAGPAEYYASLWRLREGLDSYWSAAGPSLERLVQSEPMVRARTGHRYAVSYAHYPELDSARRSQWAVAHGLDAPLKKLHHGTWLDLRGSISTVGLNRMSRHAVYASIVPLPDWEVPGKGDSKFTMDVEIELTSALAAGWRMYGITPTWRTLKIRETLAPTAVLMVPPQGVEAIHPSALTMVDLTVAPEPSKDIAGHVFDSEVGQFLRYSLQRGHLNINWSSLIGASFIILMLALFFWTCQYSPNSSLQICLHDDVCESASQKIAIV